MDRQQQVYLVLDVAGDSAEKRDVVVQALPTVMEVVRSDPAAFLNMRFALLFFDDQPEVTLGLNDLTELDLIPRPPSGHGRSWHRVFARLLEQIKAGQGTFHGMPRPVVLFVVDGPPDDPPERWRSDLQGLVDGVHPAVHAIGYGAAPFNLLDELVQTVGNGSRRVPGNDRPLEMLTDAVLELRRGKGGQLAKPLVQQVRTVDGSAEQPPRSISPQPREHRTVQDVPVAPPPMPQVHDPVAPQAPAPASQASAPKAPPPAREPQAQRRPPPDPSEPRWKGGFTPYAVGDAGRGAEVRPLPDRAEWRVPDTILDGVVTPDAAGFAAVELRAASVRGLSHRYYGKVRQDHYAFCLTTNGRYLVVSVSDGVSAATQSQRAATTVCLSGCSGIVQQLESVPPDNLDWQQLVEDLTSELIAEARQLARAEGSTFTPKDAAATHAATALFAVVDLEPALGNLAVQVFSVGDSPAWVLRNGTGWQSLQAVKNEGAVIASARTRALPVLGSELEPAMSTTLGPTDVLVLMTDGIGDPLGDGQGEVGRFLAEVWARPPAPLDFAAQVDFARKTHDDDRTAVAMWPARLS